VATRRRSDNHYDLDMNDIHQTIEWVSEKNPDQHQILILKTPPDHIQSISNSNNPITAEASAVLEH
jgi:hypothetical protein